MHSNEDPVQQKKKKIYIYTHTHLPETGSTIVHSVDG